MVLCGASGSVDGGRGRQGGGGRLAGGVRWGVDDVGVGYLRQLAQAPADHLLWGHKRGMRWRGGWKGEAAVIACCCGRGGGSRRSIWRRVCVVTWCRGHVGGLFSFSFCVEKRRSVIVSSIPAGVCLFSFSFCVEEKTKVSDREFDSRGRHSACETLIAYGEIAVPVMK